jgi:glycosyltransferase involved in cell wall biosynthesis
VIPYIHDVFLLSRRGDLNWRAKLYSAWPFTAAVRRLPRFLVNSHDTAAKLAQYCRPDAEIVVYRPQVNNLFGLSDSGRAARPARPITLRLAALGTIEPRKNYLAAARIVAALRQRGFPDATLEVIGRPGWGGEWEKLRSMPGVVLHGYVPDRQAKDILERADVLLCTSHEEGLGLPLLEAQYAGLPVAAPDQPIFREVLGRSGLPIDPAQPVVAADAIAAMIAGDGWRADFSARAAQNLQRWNDLAASDRAHVIDMLDNGRRQAGQAAGQFVAAR